jgi:hypothetical protein
MIRELPAWAFSLLLLVGCERSDPAQFGCLADSDCRSPRTCVRGACTDPAPLSAQGTDASVATPGVQLKFCNNIVAPSGEVVSLTLVFESAPGRPRLTATNDGRCVPPSPNACLNIPPGRLVPFSAWQGTTQVGTGALEDVAAGEQYLLSAELESSAGEVGLYVARLEPAISCSAVGRFSGRKDGGAP